MWVLGGWGSSSYCSFPSSLFIDWFGSVGKEIIIRDQTSHKRRGYGKNEEEDGALSYKRQVNYGPTDNK